MILVTGGAGYLGNMVVRKLISQGEEVRVFLFPGESEKGIEGLTVERMYGDVRSPQDIERAIDGCSHVIHTAGLIAITSHDEKRLQEVNVNGTQNIVNACARAGTKKLVYVSSIHAFEEIPDGAVYDEDVQFSPWHAIGAYGKSKARATLSVLKAAKRGLNASIVCPTGIIGPPDFSMSRMGRLILDFARGKNRFYLDGGYNFVDVRDVADGVVIALEKGGQGEVYILSGEYVTLKDLFLAIADFMHIKPRLVHIPFFFCRIASLFTTAYAKISGKEPLFTDESLHIIRSNGTVSHVKSSAELGFSSRPIGDTIRDTLQWFIDKGILRFGGKRKNDRLFNKVGPVSRM